MDTSRIDALSRSFATSRAHRRGVVYQLSAGLLAMGGALAWTQGGTAQDARKRRGTDRKRVGSEVFGGQPVPIGTYPFVVSIGAKDRVGIRRAHFCGGSLIAPSYVLTAAHCAVDLSLENLELIIGRTDLNSTEGERRGVSSITIHPGYDNAATNTNDVALFRLTEPVTTVQPIALIGLGDQTYDQPNTPLTIAGWGDIREWTGYSADEGVYPDQMQERVISVVSDEECDKQWRGKKKKKKKKGNSNSGITEEVVICTTAGVYGYGDSGGPAFVSRAGGYVQITLVSGGDSFQGPDYGPQLSAPPIHDFITSVINA